MNTGREFGTFKDNGIPSCGRLKPRLARSSTSHHPSSAGEACTHTFIVRHSFPLPSRHTHHHEPTLTTNKLVRRSHSARPSRCQNTSKVFLAHGQRRSVASRYVDTPCNNCLAEWLFVNDVCGGYAIQKDNFVLHEGRDPQLEVASDTFQRPVLNKRAAVAPPRHQRDLDNV